MEIYGAIYELGLGSAMPTKIVKQHQGFIMHFASEADRDKVLACKVLHVGGIELALNYMPDQSCGDQQLYPLFNHSVTDAVEPGDGHGYSYAMAQTKSNTEFAGHADNTSFTHTNEPHPPKSVVSSGDTQADPASYPTDAHNRRRESRYTNPELYGFSRSLLEEAELFNIPPEDLKEMDENEMDGVNAERASSSDLEYDVSYATSDFEPEYDDLSDREPDCWKRGK